MTAVGTVLKSISSDRALELWQRVYWEICGVEPRLQDIKLPDDPGEFGWPIVATPEIPLNVFYAGLRSKFNCCSRYGNDLERSLDWDRQERTYHNGSYAVRVHDVVEADTNLKKLSAETIAERGICTATLDERIRLEGLYWTISNGKHLDMQNQTLCCGSRDSDDLIPRVFWDISDCRFCIDWSSPRHSSVWVRAREVSCLAQV